MSTTYPLDEAARRRAVAWAEAVAAGTSLVPGRYERHLLARYVAGELALHEVEELCNQAVYRVLYRSLAAPPLAEPMLAALLAQSREYNTAHYITGLLLHCEGHFAQLLEGPAAAVRALFAHIQRDPRHRRIVTLHAELGPARLFGEHSMAYAPVTPTELAALNGSAAAHSAAEAVRNPWVRQLVGLLPSPTDGP